MNDNDPNNRQKHVRRPHYKGAYPRAFIEKYKELDPAKYGDTVAKVISKGSTPAGAHISIMVTELMDFLRIQPGQVGLDVTLGYGGHSKEMLKRLEGRGHLYALDVDTIEMEKTGKRLADLGYGPEILTIRHLNFADADELTREAGHFDFVMADLGVSSMQIDNPDRGFSYKTDGPLDLRMDSVRGVPASERLKELTKAEIAGMLTENADEPYAAEIAAAITARLRKSGGIETTTALREVIEEALSFLPASEREETIKKTCQRTFQALRIDVNSEFEALESFLDKLPGIMAPGGRAAILTFHSGEDRLVKKAFKEGLRTGVYSEISKDVIRPSAEECRGNGRARSTKMRWAVRAE